MVAPSRRSPRGSVGDEGWQCAILGTHGFHRHIAGRAARALPSACGSTSRGARGGGWGGSLRRASSVQSGAALGGPSLRVARRDASDVGDGYGAVLVLARRKLWAAQ